MRAGSRIPARSHVRKRAAALAQSARVTNAMGRTGGALGLRQALAAQESAGVQAANNAAVTGTQAQLQNQQLINSTRFGLAGLGQQQQGLGAALQQNAAGAITDMGLTREQLYNQQLAGMESQQLQSQVAYEQARQQSKLDKRRLIVGLGAGLLGAGGNIMASGMGGR